MINQLFDQQLALTGTAGAYSANDIYHGLISVDLGLGADVHAFVTTLILDDDDNIGAACKLHLFSAAPSVIADNGAASFSKADRAKRRLVIPIAAADYVTVGGKKQAFLQEKSLTIRLPGGVLYAYLTLDATPTFTSTTPLTLGIAGYLA